MIREPLAKARYAKVIGVSPQLRKANPISLPLLTQAPGADSGNRRVEGRFQSADFLAGWHIDCSSKLSVHVDKVNTVLVTFKTEPKRAPRKWRRVGWLLVLAFVLAAPFFAFRWSGQRKLSRWMKEMEAKGEVFDPAKLWSRASADRIEFSNQFALAISQLPPAIGSYAGCVSGLVETQTGRPRRGSQEPKPFLGSQINSTNTWENLASCVQLAQPALQSLRDLMKDPPSGVDYDITQRLETDSLPNYVGVRRAAQALHAAVIQDLHGGNLEAAEKNLSALSAFVKLREGDPSLIWFMIRVAVLGLSVDAYWDAVQDDGWTEPQLATLQEACRSHELLSQLPRTMAAERLVRLHHLQWFRSHSYGDWVDRYQGIYESFGSRPPSTTTNLAVFLWRQQIFHPAWSFAWADEEQLNYLRDVQEDLEILRKGTEQGSWITLSRQIGVRRSEYRPPAASWRFYIKLPFVDYFSDVTGASPVPAAYPYPDFSRAWFVTMKNLTLNQMVSTAIALKRYQLRHGQLPASLVSLVPEFLPDTPHDYMDGQILRYRSNNDGSSILYSVAEDAVDDGGNPLSADSSNSSQPARAWTGRDWVWLQVGTTTHAGLCN